jgi:ribonuclease BN (tRNA processing enzyme)
VDAVSGIEVTPVGIGAAYGRVGEAQACHLVRAAGRTICLDLGAGALNLLRAHVAPEDLDLVVISHLHPDHFIDLLALRVYMVWGPGAGCRLRVAGPPGLRSLLACIDDEGLDRAFAFEELSGDAPVTELGDGVGIRHRQVPHLPPTFATRVDAGGASVCFGADCAPNDALPDLARGVDVLVSECSYGTGEIPAGAMHLNARAAGLIARQADAGQLVLVHCFPEWDPAAAVAAAQETGGLPVRAARSGERIVA